MLASLGQPQKHWLLSVYYQPVGGEPDRLKVELLRSSGQLEVHSYLSIHFQSGEEGLRSSCWKFLA